MITTVRMFDGRTAEYDSEEYYVTTGNALYVYGQPGLRIEPSKWFTVTNDQQGITRNGFAFLANALDEDVDAVVAAAGVARLVIMPRKEILDLKDRINALEQAADTKAHDEIMQIAGELL